MSVEKVVANIVFHVINGVGQVDNVSPVLFCLYFDVLLHSLSAQDMDCHVGCHAYAATSANAMRLLLGLLVYDEYAAAQYNAIFNATKSRYLRCRPV